MAKIFALTSTDLTHLGGPMGSEYTTTNYIKYFTATQLAKDYAEADYKKQMKRGGWKKFKKIKWKKDEDGDITSGDLRFISFSIELIKVNPKFKGKKT